MTTAETLDFCRYNLLPITLLSPYVDRNAPRIHREFVPLADGTWQVRHHISTNVAIWCDRCGTEDCAGYCSYEHLTDEELLELLGRSRYRGNGIWSACRPMEAIV